MSSITRWRKPIHRPGSRCQCGARWPVRASLLVHQPTGVHIAHATPSQPVVWRDRPRAGSAPMREPSPLSPPTPPSLVVILSGAKDPRTKSFRRQAVPHARIHSWNTSVPPHHPRTHDNIISAPTLIPMPPLIPNPKKPAVPGKIAPRSRLNVLMNYCGRKNTTPSIPHPQPPHNPPPGAPCTPSSTSTPHTPSSTEPPSRKTSSTRRSRSATTPSPSPTTTASTAPWNSPSSPRPPASPPSPAPKSPSPTAPTSPCSSNPAPVTPISAAC